MKPAVLKKVREIKDRVRDLKASFIVAIKAAELPKGQLTDADQRLIPRVSAIVIREGNWLVKMAKRIHDRNDVVWSDEDKLTVDLGEAFFGELAVVHAEEIKKNGFIHRIDADFITYMEKLVLLINRLDADVRAKVAAVATLDDEEGDDAELAREIAAEMTM